MDNTKPTPEQLEREISDLRRQVSELTASRNRFRDLVENTCDWVWEVDLQGRYTYVSPRVKDLLGREPDDLIGASVFDIMPPAEAQRVAEIFQSILERVEPFEHLQNICLHADGSEVLMATSGVPILGPDGALQGYRGIDRDITEHKLIEDALRAEKDFSNTLVQASPAFIVAIAPDGKTMLMNESMRQELGYSEDEVVGADYLTTFVPQPDRAMLSEVFQKLKGTTEATVNRNHLLARDGRELLVEWRGRQIYDADGKLEYFIGLGIDITTLNRTKKERKRLEEQLRQAQKMEAVGELAGGIAHDFNNILTAIQGNAELLKMDMPAASEQTTFADQIIKSANRAADLTKQLLAFARKGKWQVVPVEIHNIITQSVSMLTHSIDKRIEIRLELHAEASTVLGDPTQLQNAMLNLGVNARDAMPSGGTLTYATRCVTLTETDCSQHPLKLTPGDFLEIQISDTGVGMDKQTQKRIFEPFFTTKEVGKGTGLGLAGVYGCIRNHEGGISVYSEPTRGASFNILLPLADRKTQTTPETTVKNTPIRGTGRILIVDDEESIRNFVSTSLKNLGYTVDTCRDGATGTDYYRHHHSEIDLVILDLIMPKMSGEDAFYEMKKIDPNVKVIVASGFSHTQTTNKMLNEGALTLLNKPFHIIELSKAVAQHIQHE